VSRKDNDSLCLQNKQQWHALQEQQEKITLWITHMGTKVPLPPTPIPPKWRGEMCPSGIAMSHPAEELLKEWSQMGCPTQMGHPWSKEEMWEAVQRGLHSSAMSPMALMHFTEEENRKGEGGAGNNCGMGQHQGSPTTRAQDITNCCNTPHVEGIPIDT
jgi:hypothetical protein